MNTFLIYIKNREEIEKNICETESIVISNTEDIQIRQRETKEKNRRL